MACSVREDAVAAWQLAAAKIAAGALPPEPAGLADLAARLAGLDSLLASGRWTRLASELDLLDRELATATAAFKEAERAVVAAMAKRDELRGLLGAYKAKAARLGGVEDPGLAERYDQARDLLWTAPCDLAAAEAAVTATSRPSWGYSRGDLCSAGPPERTCRLGQHNPAPDADMTARDLDDGLMHDGNTGVTCPVCGGPAGAADSFCESCGTELAPPVSSTGPAGYTAQCPVCSLDESAPPSAISAEGYCESCGRKVPSGRDHVRAQPRATGRGHRPRPAASA